MKSPGEMLKEACDKSGMLLTVAKAYGGFADGYANAEKLGTEQVAREYDKARAQLPDDVEAFVGLRESRIDEAERKGLGAIADPVDVHRRLIAIVREQGAEKGAAMRMAEHAEQARKVAHERWLAFQDENAALRERLAKLEATAEKSFSLNCEMVVYPDACFRQKWGFEETLAEIASELGKPTPSKIEDS